jgi:hypothetical protein
MPVSVLGKGIESTAKEKVVSIGYFTVFSAISLLPLGSFLVASFI